MVKRIRVICCAYVLDFSWQSIFAVHRIAYTDGFFNFLSAINFRASLPVHNSTI